jgi:ribonuclease HI
MLTLEFDGLFRGAPGNLHLTSDAGVMCYGWVILRDDVVIARGHGGYARGRDASSNVAEYLALIEGLEALIDMQATREPLLICGDAKSVIQQMEGEASVSASSIKPLNRRALRLAQRFSDICWTWKPRRHNHTADALTRRALQQIKSNATQMESAFACAPGHSSNRLRSLLDLRMYQAA